MRYEIYWIHFGPQSMGTCHRSIEIEKVAETEDENTANDSALGISMNKGGRFLIVPVGGKLV